MSVPVTTTKARGALVIVAAGTPAKGIHSVRIPPLRETPTDPMPPQQVAALTTEMAMPRASTVSYSKAGIELAPLAAKATAGAELDPPTARMAAAESKRLALATENLDPAALHELLVSSEPAPRAAIRTEHLDPAALRALMVEPAAPAKAPPPAGRFLPTTDLDPAALRAMLVSTESAGAWHAADADERATLEMAPLARPPTHDTLAALADLAVGDLAEGRHAGTAFELELDSPARTASGTEPPQRISVSILESLDEAAAYGPGSRPSLPLLAPPEDPPAPERTFTAGDDVAVPATRRVPTVTFVAPRPRARRTAVLAAAIGLAAGAAAVVAAIAWL